MGLFKRSSVGMEIDSNEIRVVCLEGSSNKPVPRVFARYALPKGIVRDGKVVSFSELGSAISAMWAQNSIKSRDVILGINNQDIIIRFAVVPDLPGDKLHNLIHFQSTDYIPVPADEIELDYSVVGSTYINSVSMLRLLLVDARKNMLNDFIKALEYARLRITDIAVSMLEVVNLIPQGMKDKPIVIINIANDFANIVIMNQNKPGLVRTISYPSTLQTYFIKLSGADKYQGFTSRSEAIDKVCNYIANEVRSSVQYFRNQEPDINFSQFYMTGSHAMDEGLLAGVQQLLQTDIAFLELNLAQGKRLSQEDSYSNYTVCYSLAIRGLEG